MDNQIPKELYAIDSPVIFFPVRHHSPAGARLVGELIGRVRPRAILIEGPADFNDRMDELGLGHELPIAIYSYVRLENERRRGAFYPFCEYSPEWQAVMLGRELGISVAFIDLPWAEIATSAVRRNRFGDGWWEQSRYIEQVAEKLGVRGMNNAWDALFEIDDELRLEEYMVRAHHYCFHLRATLREVDPVDLWRERFMAERVREVLDEGGEGPVLVVTGGFHSFGLWELLNFDAKAQRREVGEGGGDTNKKEHDGDGEKHRGTEARRNGEEENAVGKDQSKMSLDATLRPKNPKSEVEVVERGIALTPFSYKRLDGLGGYESGMPSPGFYGAMWAGEGHLALIGKVAVMLRERGQMVSAADLIAVDSMAQSLAQLRGHGRVWRTDVIDAVIGGLVKEELAQNRPHPFLTAVLDLFRGEKRGRLAEGTTLPPLVVQVQALLRRYDLFPTDKKEHCVLDLFEEALREKSQVLHQLRVLEIPGFGRVGGSDVVGGEAVLREVWEIEWVPEFDAKLIEAAIYGVVLDEAARARLYERIQEMEDANAAEAAEILLDGAQIGLPEDAGGFSPFGSEFEKFYRKLAEVIGKDGNYFSVTEALRTLLYLYRFDEVLGTLKQADVGELLRTTFARSLWLLEGLGVVSGKDTELLRSLRTILETFERCGEMLTISKEDLCGTLARIGQDTGQTPLLRGAVIGVLWSLDAAEGEEILHLLKGLNAPEKLGDFLTGLFALGREVIQRRPELLDAIDELLVGYDEEAFLAALPSLRLAFTTFTPREKHDIATQLFVEDGVFVGERLADLGVTVEQAAEVLAFEDGLFAAMKKYGLWDN